MCLDMILDQLHIDVYYHFKFVFPIVYTSSHKTYAIGTPNTDMNCLSTKVGKVLRPGKTRVGKPRFFPGLGNAP